MAHLGCMGFQFLPTGILSKMVSFLRFVWELCSRAADSLLSAMGTTALALFVGLLLIPGIFLVIKYFQQGGAQMIEHWKTNLRDGTVVTLAVWLILFGYQLFYKVPHKIWEEFNSLPNPQSIVIPIKPPPIAKTFHAAHEPTNELEMKFTDPWVVGWSIKNSTNTVIRDIHYWFGLVDLDQPFISPSPLAPSVPFNPLPILSQKVDFINRGEAVGSIIMPTDLINRLHLGDRIFGVASFSYPNGPQKQYWLFFKFRNGGWYARATKPIKFLPIDAIANDPTNRVIDDLVPVKSRIEIKQ
jgi:hypothetical protein